MSQPTRRAVVTGGLAAVVAGAAAPLAAGCAAAASAARVASAITAGALAIGGHGTAVPARGERLAPGHTYGGLSNLVVSLDVVAADSATGRYGIRTIRRGDPEAGPLLCHLGRALVTSVTLALGPRQHLRCRSTTLVPTTTLLAAPGSRGTTLSSLLDSTGRVEIIHFPFTTCAWLKAWQVAPVYPLGARPVLGPYNYPFSDRLPDEVTSLVARIQTGHPELAPLLGPAQLDIVRAGLLATASTDLWGPAPHLLRYVKPTTLRVTANGYAVLCARSDVQRAAHDFWETYTRLVAAYRARGQYPMNGPLEIRVTGLDDPADVGVASAADPWLSPTRARPDRPEFDCAIWFDVLTLPGTPAAAAFYTELEAWMFAHYTAWADVRVEWSKGWAYTADGAWRDAGRLDDDVPASLRRGQAAGTGAPDAGAALGRLDPRGVFTTPLTDRLLH